MNRLLVSSSNLNSIGYDKNTLTLEIEFNTGNIYQYFGVPDFEHENLLNASSHGSYFYDNIRTSYKYLKI